MSRSEKTRAIFRLRGELLIRHGLTLKDFAHREGFKLITVKKVIQRYWGTGDTPPRGEISRAILGRLHAYVEHSEPPSEGEEPGGEEENPGFPLDER